MLKKMLAVAISGFFAVLAYSGPARATSPCNLNGSFVVQASGTAYFPAVGDPPNGTPAYYQQEVLHFTMAGSATFVNGANTAVDLTLNLGGVTAYEDTMSFWSYSGNDVICHFTHPGDLSCTAATSSTPAMLTVKTAFYTGCMQPSGLTNVSEQYKVIPFNFYPTQSSTVPAGVIVSNYTYATAGGTSAFNYPNAFIDAFGNAAYDFSAIGQVTPTFTVP